VREPLPHLTELLAGNFHNSHQRPLRPTDAGLVRDASPEWLQKGVDSSLGALGIDQIDLYLVHWLDPTVPASETAGALADLVSEGKIRHVGVSNYDTAQVEEFSATLPVETVQPPYHLFRRDIEDELLPYCHAHNIGVFVYGPLAHGLLTGTVKRDTSFAAEDWRGKSDIFSGDSFLRNLEVVAQLERLAADLGVTISQLAIAWTLPQPGVHVATSVRNIWATSKTVPARLMSRCLTQTLPLSRRS